MKTTKIRNGDFILEGGQRVKFVWGKNKLLQDLELWLREPRGTSFLFPNFGAELHDMIGRNDIRVLRMEVENEVSRVLRQYQTNQLQKLKRAKKENTLRNWSKSEILDEIHAVETKLRGTAVFVRIRFSTLGSGSLEEANITINEDGVEVTERPPQEISTFE